ncbi:DUF6084 family protein [Schlesneria paludicola]|uniref:DUF6084 family protein n=1 Tax=Schlesneria paludicola TaxID=360056 RepID=UPI00029B4B41|nr:DUF6084 family protein [Schlesneria paludicola]
MSDLEFHVEDATSLEHAVVPTLILKLRIKGGVSQSIQNVNLQCQIQIESNRRAYTQNEQTNLIDLFGAADRWGETLRSMHWTRVSTLVPPFQREVLVDVQIPCTYDFNVAATKYFYGLEQGDIPLLLLFSGSIFYRQETGMLQVTQIPWSKEARYRLPVSTWKQMMEFYYPNSAWLCLRHDVFDQLYRFKCHQGIPTWDETLQRLLASTALEVPT